MGSAWDDDVVRRVRDKRATASSVERGRLTAELIYLLRVDRYRTVPAAGDRSGYNSDLRDASYTVVTELLAYLLTVGVNVDYVVDNARKYAPGKATACGYVVPSGESDPPAEVEIKIEVAGPGLALRGFVEATGGEVSGG